MENKKPCGKADRLEIIAKEISSGLREKGLSFLEVDVVLFRTKSNLKEVSICDVDKEKYTSLLGTIALRVIDVMKKENLTHNQVRYVLAYVQALLRENKI